MIRKFLVRKRKQKEDVSSYVSRIESLASKIRELLSDPGTAQEIGERGFEASRKCHIEEGVKSESELLLRIIEGED